MIAERKEIQTIVIPKLKKGEKLLVFTPDLDKRDMGKLAKDLENIMKDKNRMTAITNLPSIKFKIIKNA